MLKGGPQALVHTAGSGSFSVSLQQPGSKGEARIPAQKQSSIRHSKILNFAFYWAFTWCLLFFFNFKYIFGVMRICHGSFKTFLFYFFTADQRLKMLNGRKLLGTNQLWFSMSFSVHTLGGAIWQLILLRLFPLFKKFTGIFFHHSSY